MLLWLYTLQQNRSPLADTVLVVRWLRATQLTRHLGGVLMCEHAASGRWSGGDAWVVPHSQEEGDRLPGILFKHYRGLFT